MKTTQTATTKTLFSEHMWEWLTVHKLPALRSNTRLEYRSHVKRLTSMPFGTMPLAKITRTDCQNALNILAENGYAKSTIQKYRTLLNQAFAFFAEERIVERNPASNLFIPSSPTKVVEALTHEQQSAIEAACARDPLGHLIIFLLYTGLRKGEMMALLWEDYDATDGSILIRKSKTDAGIRKVYLIETTQRIIERMPKINDHIFNHTKGRPITPTVLRRLVDRLRNKTGLTTFACHVCRHTFVTRLCGEGVPAKAIAQIIGHAKTDYVLDIYAKMEADELRKAIYVLDPNGKRHSALMGVSVSLPIKLYSVLKEEATRQKVSVDAMVTFLLGIALDDKNSRI